MNFSSSGNLGDLIYSLAAVKKSGHGKFYVKLNNILNVIQKYNNGPVPVEYIGKLSQQDFDMLKPLIEVQSYIDSVDVYNDEDIDIDLDEFRGTIHKTVVGNFLQVLFHTHNISHDEKDLKQPWITVPNPKFVNKLVVARSPRWHGSNPIPQWKTLIDEYDFEKNAVFVGLPSEHEAFVKPFNIDIPYYPVKDFLELAQVIAGCNVFFGNQTFTYSIAQALGKPTVLETFRDRINLTVNECYFPRSDCFYF